MDHTLTLYESLVEASPEAMLLVDEAGCVVFINRRGEQMFGFVRSELFGLPMEVLMPHAFRASHEGHRKLFVHSQETRLLGHGRDLCGLRKSGEEFPVEIGLNPVSIGDQTMVVVSLIDISERKEVERNLQEALTQLENAKDVLEQEVAHRTQALQDTLERLQETQTQLIEGQKLAMMGRMAAGIAHEVNTPLAAVEVSNRIVKASISILQAQFSKVFRPLGDAVEARFQALLARCTTTVGPLSHEHRRQKRVALETALGHLDRPIGPELQEVLAELGLDAVDPDWQDLLFGDQALEVFRLALHFTDIHRANLIIEEATSRASRFVGALVTAMGPETGGS